MLHLYNTLTRRREALRPLRAGRVSIYTCGPTVYRFVHIGNLRSYLLADLIRRTLELLGQDVRQVKNITDVGHLTDEMFDRGEDKMLLAARLEQRPPQEIAAFYTAAFHQDEARINILPAHVFPRASEHIGEMIGVVQTLLEKGFAYQAGTAVYYDISAFPAYGELSGNTQARLQAGHRVRVDERKRNPSDFVLWNVAADRRLMKWPSPWGEGYPGWHIECTAMSVKHLGERFDIHTGGIDNVFPHHEDEIAQTQAYLGHLPAQMWVHGEHLLVEGKKMAKSAGNVVHLADLLERGLDPLAFRYLCLGSRYRAKLNFTWDAIWAAQRGLNRLRAAVLPGPATEQPSEAARAFDEAFRGRLEADLDTPGALVILERMLAATLPAGDRLALLRSWDRVLGLDLLAPPPPEPELSRDDLALVEARSRARDRRDFAEADRLRAALAARGIALADGPAGTAWRRVGVTNRSNL